MYINKKVKGRHSPSLIFGGSSFALCLIQVLEFFQLYLTRSRLKKIQITYTYLLKTVAGDSFKQNFKILK